MFNSQIYHSWLDRKTDEILSKVNRETITTEEMLILILKDQSTNFVTIDQRFEKIDQRFERMDKKIEDQFKWTLGLIMPLLISILLKLFLK